MAVFSMYSGMHPLLDGACHTTAFGMYSGMHPLLDGACHTTDFSAHSSMDHPPGRMESVTCLSLPFWQDVV